MYISDQDFNNIFIKYYSQLCAFAYRYVRDRQITEDIVQDVFCRLVERREEIHNLDSIRSFLYLCTRNKAIDYLKYAGNQHECLDNYLNNSELESYVDQLIINRMDEKYDYQIINRIIHSLISSLPEKTKMVFLLSRQQNMSNKEIAAHLDISIKSVEKHITKALSTLRKGLQDNKIISYFLLFIFSIK